MSGQHIKPAGVEGLTDAQKIERMADLNWKPASAYWKEQHDAKAAALTALQAENERLRNTLRHNTIANDAAVTELLASEAALQARAERAEAERDAWKEVFEGLANSFRPQPFGGDYLVLSVDVDRARAAYAKLKGGV